MNNMYIFNNGVNCLAENPYIDANYIKQKLYHIETKIAMMYQKGIWRDAFLKDKIYRQRVAAEEMPNCVELTELIQIHNSFLKRNVWEALVMILCLGTGTFKREFEKNFYILLDKHNGSSSGLNLPYITGKINSFKNQWHGSY